MLVSIRNGQRLLLRPIAATDKDALALAFSRLSAETRRLRFLGPKPRLSKRELRYLTEVDGCSHYALVAIATDGPWEGDIMGVGRWVRLPEASGTAEFAIVVGDGIQGLGLGSILARQLARAARERGVRSFTAIAYEENRPVRRLLEHISSGLVRDEHHDGVAELEGLLAA